MLGPDKPPPQFRYEREICRRGGRITLYIRSEPATLLAVARGFVGTRLVREDLGFAQRFGRAQTGPWRYVADVSLVRIVNPLNVLWLRRIQHAVNLGEYVVVAPNPVVRLALRALSGLVGARVVAALVQANAT